MGLSTSSVVQAAPGDITVLGNKYVCSLSTCGGTDVTVATNDSLITVEDGTDGGNVKITNLDVATVANNINPRTVAFDGNNTITIRVVQEFTDVGWPEQRLARATEIRTMPLKSGASTATVSRLSTGQRTSNTFATYATITVDNVKPTLITKSPAIPLIAKGSTVLTFSADITDGGSGYSGKVGTSAPNEVGDLVSDAGILADVNDTTAAGSVRLVVAGNVVALGYEQLQQD